MRFERVDVYTLPDELGTFDGEFAGSWFSHVPVKRCQAFLDGLHSRFRRGAHVMMIDNATVRCRELPITETDGRGNTYQQRRLPDGSEHRVLKNVATVAEWRALLPANAADAEFRELENCRALACTLA